MSYSACPFRASDSCQSPPLDPGMSMTGSIIYFIKFAPQHHLHSASPYIHGHACSVNIRHRSPTPSSNQSSLAPGWLRNAINHPDCIDSISIQFISASHKCALNILWGNVDIVALDPGRLTVLPSVASIWTDHVTLV